MGYNLHSNPPFRKKSHRKLEIFDIMPPQNQPVESSSSSPKWYQIREIIALHVGVKKNTCNYPPWN